MPLNISSHLRLSPETILAPDLTSHFSPEDLRAIGEWVWAGYDKDQQSRAIWMRRSNAGMDLAMQLVREKSFPWPGCANVAFPLVTIAALQFHSRAYPSLVPPQGIAKMRVVGDDPSGALSARALRVGKHMSYQLLEQSSNWEEQHDRATLNYSIVGTMFKKTYYNGVDDHPDSDFVPASHLVVNYWATSIESATRKTHIIPLTSNDIYSKVKLGIFRDVLEEGWYQGHPAVSSGELSLQRDRRLGLTQPMPDDLTPFNTLEQHVLCDLDGDGYAEPYIITIEAESRSVLRIVCGFDREEDILRNPAGEIVKVTPTQYFTKYGFIPSPDGGVYDVGFGVLLGPLAESTSSIINQLLDAGTLASTAGGFLGRGAKLRGGDMSFSPFSWNKVDSTGEDLGKSIFPLPVREPSPVLFQLLGLLIEYTNRISGATDMQVGENPGQNMKAQTAEMLLEQGQKVYSAIFKRHWRSLKEELKKLYTLNTIHMSARQPFPGGLALHDDYMADPRLVVPAADPNVVSKTQRLQQAMALKQAAMTTNGYDLKAVEHNYLEAMEIDGVERFYPGPDKVPPLPNPKVMVEQMKAEIAKEKLKLEKLRIMGDFQEQQRLNSAKISQLEAQAAKFLAEAGGVEQGQLIAAFNASIGALKVHNDTLHKEIELMLKGMEHDAAQENGSAGDVRGVAGAPGHGASIPPARQMAGGDQGSVGTRGV